MEEKTSVNKNPEHIKGVVETEPKNSGGGSEYVEGKVEIDIESRK
ncbi:hypothetical protein IKQ_06003 [Bacillus cereus VDM053]|nr:hypothetical protein IKQ_06003 [Bacillus cereus VDM053]